MLDWEEEKILIYLAGFLDGEGHFGVRTFRAQRNSVRICVANTHHGVLLFIKSKLLGFGITSSISEVRRRIPGNRQRCWTLEVSSKCVGKLCDMLKSYLIVKHEQAELLSRFAFLRNVEGKTGIAFDTEETDIYLRLKVLNKRGVC